MNDKKTHKEPGSTKILNNKKIPIYSNNRYLPTYILFCVHIMEQTIYLHVCQVYNNDDDSYLNQLKLIFQGLIFFFKYLF